MAPVSMRAERTAGRRVDAEAGVVYGPCLGEFAHEMMGAHVLRGMAKELGRLIVCTRKGREALYAGIACEFMPHDIQCEGNCNTQAANEHIGEYDLRKYQVDGLRCMAQLDVNSSSGNRRVRSVAKFYRYGAKDPAFEGCIIIHARNRNYVVRRNWPIEMWNSLARHLRKQTGRRIVCVGTTKDALRVEGAFDARSLPLQRQMDILASGLFCMGPSSGPIHLAEHCGTPVLTWCGGGESEREITASRYRERWNPFGVKAAAYIQPNWRPSYATVLRWTHAFLEELSA